MPSPKFAHNVPVVLDHPTADQVRAMPSFLKHFKASERGRVVFGVHAWLETTLYPNKPRNYRTRLVAFLDGKVRRTYWLMEDPSKIKSYEWRHGLPLETEALTEEDLEGAMTARDWRRSFRE